MKVEITQEDIDKGIKGTPSSCAVALALERTFNTTVSVGTSDVRFVEISLLRKFNLSKNVRKFIHNFDMGEKVKPMSFTIIDPYKWKASLKP